MPTSPVIIDSRSANAFFEKAHVSESLLAARSGKAEGSVFKHLGRPLRQIISNQISKGRQRQGGLWVGGRSVLTRSTLEFSPNAMNHALHADPKDLYVQIPLSSITSIQVRRRLISDAIDIRTDAGTLTIRCFKAKSFAAAIRAAKDPGAS